MLSILTNAIGSGSSTKNEAKVKSFKDMLIDSGTIAAIALFSVWSGVPTWEQLGIVLKATGISFFVQLAYERGIKRIIE